MRKYLRTASAGSSLLLLLWGAAALWAADPHAGGGRAGGGPHLSGLFFAAINFLLFIYLLRRVAFGWVRERVRERHDTIVRTMAEAGRVREEAEALRREYEDKLRGLEEERRGLRAQMVEAAERECDRMREETRRLASRVLEEARSVALREREEARHELRREVARLVAEAAARLIEQRLTEADRSRIVEEFAREVGDARGRI